MPILFVPALIVVSVALFILRNVDERKNDSR